MKARFRSVLFAVVLWNVVACDRIADEAAPGTDPIDVEEIAYYTLPDQQVAIDLKSISGLSAVTTLRITQTPRLGRATFNGSGLLVYTPRSTFVVGEDQFVVSAANASTLARSFRINMAADSSRIPCNAGPLPDWYRTPENKTVIMDVLKNDRFCDATVDLASLEVGQQPEHGQLTVENGKVIYAPTAGFNGFDYFFYKVKAVFSDKDRTFLAPVKIGVGDPYKDCQISLRDDDVYWKQWFITDSLRIPVLSNDQLCRSRFDLPITITKAPSNGTAKVRNNMVIYYPANGFAGEDQLTYNRCDKGECQEATARISISGAGASCTLQARNDNGQILSAALPPDPARRVVFIYALGNDQVCAPLRHMVITDNPSQANLQVLPNGVITYRPTAGFKGNLHFTYELTDVNNHKSSAAVNLAIK
ncbi:Ig-like domain-containing protein [Larkinella insperata]|uniref:Ig-like domain-containing protein n=1 Tax=Larkinella insperata TaxID=332158 RepID=A0ABW3QES7_9BACT|nr:Ig-like domain-containing protein [Larkinella insperata]